MKAFCIKDRVAACADQYISVSGLFDESRDWSRDKSRVWNTSKSLPSHRQMLIV